MSSTPRTIHDRIRNETFGQGPAFDIAAELDARVIAMPGASTPHAGEDTREESRETRTWQERVNGLNPNAAKLLLTDPLLIRLDAVQFGIVVRLHAMTRAGSPLTARMKVAAKVLGVTAKRLADTLLELQTLSPGLVTEEAGLLVCEALVSRPYVSHSEKRSAASNARWDKERRGGDDDSIGAPGQQPAAASQSQQAPRAMGFRRLQQIAPAAAAAQQLAEQPKPISPDQGAPAQGALFDDVDVPATGKPDAKRAPNCPYNEIVKLFNSICISLTRVRNHDQWTSVTRKADVQKRWVSHPTLDFWKEYFSRVEKSDRLTGRQDSPWRADFDWVMKPTHFDRIMDGVYDNRAGSRRGMWNKGGAAAAPSTPMESDIDESAPFLQAHTGGVQS